MRQRERLAGMERSVASAVRLIGMAVGQAAPLWGAAAASTSYSVPCTAHTLLRLRGFASDRTTTGQQSRFYAQPKVEEPTSRRR